MPAVPGEQERHAKQSSRPRDDEIVERVVLVAAHRAGFILGSITPIDTLATGESVEILESLCVTVRCPQAS
jgi:hypothetical protein